MAFNVSVSNQKQDEASLLALANVEILAEAEELEVICGRAPGLCWIKSDRLKFCKEYAYYECDRSDDPQNSCYEPC